MPFSEDNFDDLDYLSGKSLKYIAHESQEGTIKAHTDGMIPCSVITADKVNDYSAGELIYFFERACGVSGNILGVNPFDQPGVESYKKNMFALLGKPGYEDMQAALEARI